MKKIFITGASSFLGETLINSLKNSYEILLLEHNRNINNQKDKNIKIINGGLENIDKWKNNLSTIDVVIHLAAITHSKDTDLYEKINAKGTADLVSESERQGVKRFIFISTRAIGECCGSYGISKKKAEEYLKKSTLIYTILRVGETYEERFESKEGLGNLVDFIKKSPVVPYLFDKNITLSPIHRDDVVNSIVASIDNKLTYFKTYNIAGPEILSFKEVIDRITKYYKLNRLFIPIPTILAKSIFYILWKFLGLLTPDQLERLLCKKELLSKEVISELRVIPRKFLST
jgi:NADH dehydrogenase